MDPERRFEEQPEEKKTEKVISREQEEANDLENCRRAIRIYLEALREATGGKIKDDPEERVMVDAETLASRKPEGGALRYGAPGYAHAKLYYSRGMLDTKWEDKMVFRVVPNGMNEEEFKQWEALVGKKFEEAELPFLYYFSTLHDQKS